MKFFDHAAFVADALQREKERVIAEIDYLIAEARAGRAFPGTPASPLEVSADQPAESPPPPEGAHLPSDATEQDGEGERVSPDESGDDPETPFAQYHGRDRESFENRRTLALDVLKNVGGEAPFSVIADAFESVGLKERKARSALDSLRSDEKAFNVKRDNPSDNTWALWDHPSAVEARRAESNLADLDLTQPHTRHVQEQLPINARPRYS